MNLRNKLLTTVYFAPDDNTGAAPSSTEPPAATTTEEDDGGAVPELTEDDFAKMVPSEPGVDDIDVEVPEGTPAQPTAPVEPAPPAPVTPAPVTAPAPASAAPQAPAAPATTETPAPVPEATPEPASTNTPAGMIAYISQNRPIAEQAAASHFTLNDDQLAELETAPGVAIPKMLARVYLDTMTSTLQHVQNMLPGMIDSHQSSRTVEAKNEEQFFGTWPQLKGHEASVAKIAKAFRSSNPAATKEEFVQNVGAMAVVALKLPNAAPAAPAASAQTTATPFVPAGSGGSTAPPPRTEQVKKNPFEAFADQLIAEDSLTE